MRIFAFKRHCNSNMSIVIQNISISYHINRINGREGTYAGYEKVRGGKGCAECAENVIKVVS